MYEGGPDLRSLQWRRPCIPFSPYEEGLEISGLQLHNNRVVVERQRIVAGNYWL
jgi:hypothetical protein